MGGLRGSVPSFHCHLQEDGWEEPAPGLRVGKETQPAGGDSPQQGWRPDFEGLKGQTSQTQRMCLESSFCFGDRTDTMRRAVSRKHEQGHIGPPGASSLLRSQRVVTLNSFSPADPASEHSEQSGTPLSLPLPLLSRASQLSLTPAPQALMEEEDS